VPQLVSALAQLAQLAQLAAVAACAGIGVLGIGSFAFSLDLFGCPVAVDILCSYFSALIASVKNIGKKFFGEPPVFFTHFRRAYRHIFMSK
jgi:hypothetical protein